jgi:hypothetical protein
VGQVKINYKAKSFTSNVSQNDLLIDKICSIINFLKTVHHRYARSFVSNFVPCFAIDYFHIYTLDAVIHMCFRIMA